VNAEQAPKPTMQELTRPVRGKAEANGIAGANKFNQTCRGGDGMQAQWTIRNTGSPSSDRGMDQLAARERRVTPVEGRGVYSDI